MTSSERKHKALARRLAMEYTRTLAPAKHSTRSLGHQVWLWLPNGMVAQFGAPWRNKMMARIGAMEIGLALATLVEREIERQAKGGKRD